MGSVGPSVIGTPSSDRLAHALSSAQRFAEQGKIDDALNLLDEALRQPIPAFDRSRVLINRAELQIDSGRYSEASADCAAVLAALHPLEEDSRVLAMKICAKALKAVADGPDERSRDHLIADAESAGKRLDEISLDPESKERLYWCLGGLCFATGHAAKAADYWQRYLLLDLSDHDKLCGLVSLGNAYTAAQRPEEALSSLEQASALDPASMIIRADIHRGMGDALLKLGRKEAAVAALYESIRLYESSGRPLDYPPLTEARLQTAAALLSTGRVSDAKAQYAILINTDLQPSDLHSTLFSMSATQLDFGLYADALAGFKALSQDPAARSPVREEAAALAKACEAGQLMESGEYAPASARLTEALNSLSDPHLYRALILQRLWSCHCALDNFGAAREFASLALGIQSIDATVAEGARATIAYCKGREMYAAGTFDVARDAFATVCEKADWNRDLTVDAQLWLGACEYRLRSYREAKRCFEAVLKNPSAPPDCRDSAREWLSRPELRYRFW